MKKPFYEHCPLKNVFVLEIYYWMVRVLSIRFQDIRARHGVSIAQMDSHTCLFIE